MRGTGVRNTPYLPGAGRFPEKEIGNKEMKEQPKQIAFFPFYLFEVTVTALFTVELVLLLAVLFPPGVGREIDPSAPYQPRPEWYFLFLYELTKYFPGRWTFVGAVLIPAAAFFLVLLAPFLDTGQATTLRERGTAAWTGLALFAAVVLLTLKSLL